MSKEMIIASSPQETKVAILEDDQLVEIHIERSQEQGLVGSIYKGRVTKVLPGMQSAFVNVGLERDAFLYVSDFFEEAEDYDSIGNGGEGRNQRLEPGAGESTGPLLTPAVIEIPTLPEASTNDVAARPAVAPPPTTSLPLIAEAAVTTQPIPVTEKVAELASQPGEESAASSTPPGGKPRNGFDRPSRGRYGRRRGRRRPWERRREETAHPAAPSAPAATPSSESGITPPPVPVVVSTLTPLPGESLSKFQSPAPRGEVQAGAISDAPLATEVVSPAASVAGEVLELGTEPAAGRFEDETAAPVESPLEALIPDAPTPTATTEPTSDAEATLEEAPIAVPAVESEMAISPTIVGPAEEKTIAAEAPSESAAPWSAGREAAAIETEFLPLPPEAEVASETRSSEGRISAALRPSVVLEETHPIAAETTSLTSPALAEIEFPKANSEIQAAPAEGVAITASVSEEKTLDGESPALEGITDAIPREVESSGAQGIGVFSLQEDAIIPSEDASLAACTPSASITEQAKTIASPPAVAAEPTPVEPKLQQTEVVTLDAPVPTLPVGAPTATPTATLPTGSFEKSFDRPRLEKQRFYKPRFEERKPEGKSDLLRTASSTPPPEVYGPPTPYEFMTAEEKAAYNAARAREKASAKITDSSRKLTAPQPRDFGFRRGRGRRGRKRFGDREQKEEGQKPAAREEKRGTGRPLITELLREGQEILVQIAKEPLGKKGARITSHIALPGRYLVYMPTVDHIGVSRKISSDEERHRLKRIINENRAGLPGGFIVRTAAEGRSEEELKQDIRFLANTWADIRSRAEKRPAPALLHRDLGVLERILRDQLTSEFTAIRLDSETEYAKVLEFVNSFQPSLLGRVKLHLKDTPIFEEYGINHEIDKALKPKVWLKSGGYIVINQTEAMVAIDVNTGKFVGKTTRLEDTIVKTNIDAAKEVARQIRLRDMGGIIVIDFIDMEERKNRQKVIQALEEARRNDRAPSKVLAFNDFGLVALTRKRVKQSLEKTLLEPCSYCQGHGMIKSVQTVCYEIQAEAKKMAALLDGREIRIRVHPDVARALKTSEQSVLSEIEAHTRKDVVLKPDTTTHQDRFEIY